MSKNSKPLFWLLFVIYIILLLKVIFFSMSLDAVKAGVTSASIDRVASNLKSANFIPLRHISGYMEMYFKPAMKIMGLKILWFVPLGYFIPSLTKRKRFKHVLIIGLSTILFFEIMQLILSLGQFDVDDIILNGIGLVLGYMFYKAFK
ncbi:VanZ family protein [Acidaminobacter sp. JC074]|uniref:VanZ family protein n=1 Tax=Acidaminobacter sp. JC074 TaxID=2530199 RepID=UPI001F119324|nr:VanZ family protein [Acidaminobacter sp. JC074]MCH4886083.1 VanZ family protein [Acidaminobacter sp. JC074]